MTWEINYNYNGSDYALDVSFRNVIGSPVLSAEVIPSLFSGGFRPLAGVFKFTMMSTTTLKIEAVHPEDIKSPSLFSGTKTVVADGATENISVLAGISLILTNTAVAGDVFEIGIGCFYDEATLSWVRVTPLGLCYPNIIPVARTLRIENTTSHIQCGTYIVATNSIRCVNSVYATRPFKCFRQTGAFDPTAHIDMLGEAVTFTDFVSGSPNTASILVGGSPIDIYDVTNSETITNGVDLSCDGSTVYRFADGTAYQSGEFVLSSSLEVTDTATLFVSDGGSFVELSNTVDDYVSGPTGVSVTSENCPDGVVSANSYVEINVRISNPGDYDITLNPRLFSLRVISEGV